MSNEINALDARYLVSAQNTSQLLKEHEKITNGMVRTRFPPEPNGYLHIGHAKSMNMNFEGAFDKLGIPKEQRQTFFRYDDTNPEAESQEYIQCLKENVEWLGWKPYRTTYSSEYFDQLYDMAISLIKKGKAYVCHQTKKDIEICRNILREWHINPSKRKDDGLSSAESPWRNRAIQENLDDFERMRLGIYDEGQCCLRLKMDLTSPNPNMWDFVAYRIKYTTHPHIGDKWCIYPTYDYTHCIVDSLEHIDYSICTLEFETRRESYYWLLQELNLFRPKVYEFARLNLTYTVLSKRKLRKLVVDKMVRGWDDPRVATLNGLRRRGYNADILNEFCREIGVTRVNSMQQVEKLQHVARKILGDTVKRAMAVLEPLKVVLQNYPENKIEEKDVPDYPMIPDRTETHKITFSRVIYIDHCDFKLDDDPNFFGLAPGKEVGLKYCYNITCTDVVKDKSGKVVELRATVDLEKKNRPKGHINWVSGKLKPVEVRVYDHLFRVEDIEADKDVPWESLLNPDSEKIYSNAFVDASVHGAVEFDCFQFERLGYFVVDKDSTTEKMVFNRTVALRDSNPAGNKENKSRKAEQEKQRELKQSRKNLNPKDLFRQEPDKYSRFDDDGIPTHDAEDQPISKSLQKKLKKEWLKQKKLFESN